jgi:uncharacterized repeat protein (TIGR01451 family)
MSESSAQTQVAWWRFAIICTAALVIGGLGFGVPALLVAGVVPLVFVVYGYTSSSPSLTVSATREFDTETPTLGGTVEVTLTIQNEGDSAITDLRVVDGVPGPLSVVDGSPRLATALLPDESVTIEYDLRARRGVFRYDPVRIRTRSLAGSHIMTTARIAGGADLIRCVDVVDAFPLPRQTRQYAGTTTADDGGEGVEFVGSREYQPTDPARRIDWNRLASTGKLTTLIHREERSRATVFLLDASQAARVGGGEGTYTGVELGAYAIERAGHTLLAEDDSVGLGILGTTVEDRPAFVKPGGGETTLDRIRLALAGVGPFVADALSADAGKDTDDSSDASKEADTSEASSGPVKSNDGTESHTAIDRLSDRLGKSDADAPPWVGRSDTDKASTSLENVIAQTASDTQFVVVSPLLDEGVLETVDTLVERQRTVSVLSPDVTRAETLGARLASLDRYHHLRQVERRGIPVVDWAADEPLQEALVRVADRVTETTRANQAAGTQVSDGDATIEEVATDA